MVHVLKVAPSLAGMEVRSAEIARRREEREQRKKDQEMERVAQLQHEEEERREAERKAREALAVQRREERKVARQVRLLSHKCNIHLNLIGKKGGGGRNVE